MNFRKKAYPITDLTGGLNLSIDPQLLADKESPNNDFIRYDESLLKKDLGSLPFANRLCDRPMLIDTFYNQTGGSWLMCATTKGLYTYNTTTNKWNLINEQTVVDTCDSSSTWTASSNITLANSEDRVQGTNSMKVTVGSAFTTGLACYKNFTAKNLSTYSHLHLWLRPSTSLDAGVVRVLLDDTDGCASPLETIIVGALIEDEWNEVLIPLTNPAGDTAICSVGIYFHSDPGAITLLVDEITATKTFTGGPDDGFSHATMNDLSLWCNGVDPAKKWNGSGYVQTLGGWYANNIIPKLFVPYYTHLLSLGSIENGYACPFRVRWSAVGAPEDVTSETAGFHDLSDTVDFITGHGTVKDRLFIFKERSIWEEIHMTSGTAFLPRLVVDGVGTYCGASIQNSGDGLIYIGSDAIYLWDGNYNTDIAPQLHHIFYRTESRIVNHSIINRAACLYVEEVPEYWACVPTAGDDPDTLIKYNFLTQSWTKSKMECTAMGYYSVDERQTWQDCTWSWAEATGRWLRHNLPPGAPSSIFGLADGTFREDDRSTPSDKEMYWETRDFTFGHACRIVEMHCVAKTTDFSIAYSVDSGTSWADEKSFTGDGLDFREYVWHLNTYTDKIRFRIKTASQVFELKWIEPWFIQKERSSKIWT